jgi:tetratricopeptide (TPR) repeat protein
LIENVYMSQKAERARNLGNEAFKRKRFKEAVTLYTEAIDLDPTNVVYYSNRSAAYQQTKQFDLMIKDAKTCIDMDKKFFKGYFRLAKGYLLLNQHLEALNVIEKLLKEEFSSEIEQEQRKEFDALAEQIDKDLSTQYFKEETKYYQYNIMAVRSNYQGNIRVDLERKRLYYDMLCRKTCETLSISYDQLSQRLDDLLKPLRNKNLTEEQRKSIIAVYEKRYRLDNQFHITRQRVQVQKIFLSLQGDKPQIQLYFIFGTMLVMIYSRPELSEPYLHYYLQNVKNQPQVPSNSPLVMINEAQGWLVASMREIFQNSYADHANTSIKSTSKSLLYIHRAVSLKQQHQYLNVHILTSVYLDNLQAVAETFTQLDVTHLRTILENLDHLWFLSNLNADHIAKIGLKVFFQLVSITSGTVPQLQEILSTTSVTGQVLSTNNDLVLKIFNSFNSVDLPLPKILLTPFFIRLLCNHIFTREDMEILFTSLRQSLMIAYKKAGQKPFLNKDMMTLYYGLAMQCYNTAYVYMVSSEELKDLQECTARAEELLQTCTGALMLNTELHDLLLLISMYHRLYGHINGVEKITRKLNSSLPYMLLCILSCNIFEPIKEESINVPCGHATCEMKTKFYSTRDALFQPFDYVHELTRDNTIIDHICTPIPLCKELEWFYGLTPKFEEHARMLTIYAGGVGAHLVANATKYGDYVHLTHVEAISERHYKFIKRQLDQAKLSNIDLLYASGLEDIPRALSNTGKFELIQVPADIASDSNILPILKDIVSHLSPNGILRLSLISHRLGEMLRDTRLYLHEDYRSGIFKIPSEGLNSLPIVERIPEIHELQEMRKKLTSSNVFKFYTQVYDYYNLNLFTDMIFNPSYKDYDKNCYNFEKTAQLVEQELGLKIISLDECFPKSVQKEYQQYAKDQDKEMKNWRLIDQFTKEKQYAQYFNSMIQVMCMKE